MDKWIVERLNDTVIVSIMRNKSDNTYSFINLTKGHICPCKFNSIGDALGDMDFKVKSGEIIRYYKQEERYENMKKIFISQPFTGKTEEEVFADRDRIISYLKSITGDEQFDIIDQYHQIAPQDAGRLWYLGGSIRMMSDADIIVFSNDWDTAPGCRVERLIASEYNFTVIVEPEKYVLEDFPVHFGIDECGLK